MVSIWVSAVYAAALWEFGFPLWKALLVGVIVLISMFVHFGSRVLSRLGVVLLILGTAVWLEVIPTPDHWGGILSHLHVKAAVASD